MTKANHERWELKLRDNFIRELRSESKFRNARLSSSSAEMISADPEDLRSAPRTSLRFDEATEDLYTLCLSISQGRERARKLKETRKAKNTFQSEIDNKERLLKAVIFVMLSELHHDDLERRGRAFLWLAWRCPLMNSDGHSDQKVMDIIFEFMADLCPNYNPDLSEKYFLDYRREKLYWEEIGAAGDPGTDNNKFRRKNSEAELWLEVQPTQARRQLAAPNTRVSKQKLKPTKEHNSAMKKAKTLKKKKSKARDSLRAENTARFLDMKREQEIP